MKVSRKTAEKILQKRTGKEPLQLLSPEFSLQNDFINDPSKLKALFATRRFGKSYSAGLYLIKEALENPGVSCIYIALTRESAKKILWKDVLKVINRKHKLGIKFNETLLTATVPNGSVIYSIGVDSSEEEKDKLLGQKYKLAIIDEAASFTIDLRELVYGTLKPAMADLSGTICMIGTPGNLTRGLFFDITTGKEPGWKLTIANTRDNPFMAKLWEDEITELLANHPGIQETPMFKQMYLGLWVVDTDKLVYKFDPSRNVYEHLPAALDTDWIYVLGVDLGYENDSAFVVAAYNERDKNLYLVETFAEPHMDITDVADKIKQLQRKYVISKIIVDGANKQAVEEIKNRHGLALVPADKTGKADFIEIMNAEFILGRIKISYLERELMAEYGSLIWATEGGIIKLPKKEHPACPNHRVDAALYAWRHTYQHFSQAAPPKLKEGSPEWGLEQQEQMREKLYESIQKEKRELNEDPLRDFDPSVDLNKWKR